MITESESPASTEAGDSVNEHEFRSELEARYGTVWSTSELTEHFSVIGFLAPYVEVQRKSDCVRGTLRFTHQPRFYFDWQAEDGWVD